MQVAALDPLGSPSARRWGLCFAVIVALHVAGVVMAMQLHPASPPMPPPAAPVMIELPSYPQTRRAPPKPPSPKHEVAKPRSPQPLAKPILPNTPSVTERRVDVPVPARAQSRPLSSVAQAQPQPDIDNRPPEPLLTTQPIAAAAPAAAAADPTVASAAPPAPAAAAPSKAVPTWQGLILARLERFKRYPAGAQFRRQQGVVYLRFSMDRRGKVVAASVDKSSGVDALDQETLALIHRAEPLPPPPAEMTGDPVELVVPIQFFLK